MRPSSCPRLFHVLVLAALLACRSAGAPIPEGSATVAVEGAIAVTGTAEESWTTLRTEDAVFHLVGEPEPELRRLDGARIRVHGVEVPRQPVPRFEVGTYEVLSIDGAVPWVGSVAVASEGTLLTTDRGELLWLVGISSVPNGAYIWVTGDRSSDTLDVHSYGVVREP